MVSEIVVPVKPPVHQTVFSDTWPKYMYTRGVTPLGNVTTFPLQYRYKGTIYLHIFFLWRFDSIPGPGAKYGKG